MKLAPKVLGLLLVVILVIMAAYSAAEIGRTEKSMRAEARRLHEILLSNAVRPVKAAVWEYNPTNVEILFKALFNNDSILALVVVDAQNKPFVAMRRNANGIEKIEDEAQVQEMLRKSSLAKPLLPFRGDEVGMVGPEAHGNETWRLVAPLWQKREDSGDFVGHLVMDFSTGYVAHQLGEMRQRVFVWAGLMAIGFLGLAFPLLQKTVLRPIRGLQDTSLSIAEGKMVRAPQRNGRDEIATLTRNFNHMVERLEHHIHGLKLLSEQGRRIGSAMTLEYLVERFEEGCAAVGGARLDVALCLSHQIIALAHREAQGFYGITVVESEGQGKRIALSEEPLFLMPEVSGKERMLVPIPHVISGETIGLISVRSPEEAEGREDLHDSLENLAVYVASALENIRFLNEQKDQQRMVAELETARLVQKSLLPAHDHVRVGPFELAGCFLPASEVGGDWWNFFPLHDGRVLILLGDVTGHGTPSALVTAVVKGYCDSIYWRKDPSPGRILEELDVVVRTSSDGSRLMTMFAAILDPLRGEIRFSNAAHNAPILLLGGETEGSSQRLLQIGYRLGFHPGEGEEKSFPEKTQSFAPGDMLVIFSDGLVEGRSPEGKEFTERRLRKLLERSAGKTAVELKEVIRNEAFGFFGDRKPDDDITYVVIRCHHDSAHHSEPAIPMRELVKRSFLDSSNG